MGGFKEFMNNQNQRKHTWDDEPPSTEQQQSQGDYERDHYDDEGDGEGEAGRGQVVEEEFTMEIMLRMAGVEEGILKWDRELNNFRKE